MTQPTEYEQVTYNAPDGAQVGNASTEKVGFFGATPAAQPSGASQTALSASQTTKTTTQLRAELNQVKVLLAKLRANLVTLGLIKGGS